MKNWMFAVLVSGVMAHTAQAASAPAAPKPAAPAAAPTFAVPADPGPQPTRMQYCQHEVKDVAKGKHKAALSACLKVRHGAERVITRDCKKEVAGVNAPLTQAQKTQWQRACEARLLAVHSSALPKPPPPKPRPKPASTAGDGGSPQSDAPANPTPAEATAQ